MKKYIPKHYKKFQCIAQKCKDNCCIGWDIMIDEKSYHRYQHVTTDFKERLLKGICYEEQPQFCLNEKKRCVFLNQENLCDIYIELGEDALCDICTQHPRFYNEYGHIMQAGIGLACEEAARLIMESDFQVEEIFEPKQEEFDEWAEELMQIELRLLRVLQNKECPLDIRIDQLFDLTAAYQEELNLNGELSVRLKKEEVQQQYIFKKIKQEEYMRYWFEVYENLDYMNEEFKLLLQKVKEEADISQIDHKNSLYEERLISYFIYRHFMKAYEDDNLLDKIKFAVISTMLIRYVDQYCQDHGVPLKIVEIAKMYSKEIEYSEENMESIYEELLFD